MSVKGQRQLEARNRERRKMEVEAEYWRKEAYAARGQAVAAEARVRELEGALERIAKHPAGSETDKRGARAALNPPAEDGLDANLNAKPIEWDEPAAEDEQHWPDEPLMHPPPKRVQKLRVHLKPADEERHKDG